MEEQDRELEAILSQLDFHDNDTLGDTPADPLQPGTTCARQPSHYRTATCEGCGKEGSMLPLEGVHVCFCWLVPRMIARCVSAFENAVTTFAPPS